MDFIEAAPRDLKAGEEGQRSTPPGWRLSPLAPPPTARAAGVLATAVLGSVLAPALMGCEAEGPAPPAAALGELFPDTAWIELEEPDDALLAQVSDLNPAPGLGRLAVADAVNHEVRVHDDEGRLVARGGGPAPGDGPGEFNRPQSVGWTAEGGLVVSEVGNLRLTFLAPDLALDSVLTPGDTTRVGQLRGGADSLLAVQRHRASGDVLDLFRQDGTHLRSFHREHPMLREAPYWSSVGTTLFDRRGDRVVAATSLLYPLILYRTDGAVVDSTLGSPPPSWRQASVPERGDFAFTDPENPVSREDPIAWQRSFTRIDRVAFLGERCLLVSHREADPDSEGLEDWIHRADLYLLEGPLLGQGVDASAQASSRKLVEDAPLPGPLMATRGSAAFILAGEPPDPWTVLRLELGEGSPCLGHP